MFLLSLCDPRVSSWQIHVYSAHYMHIHVSRKRSVKSTTGYTDCCACKFKNIVSLKILKLFTDVRFVCVSGLDANDGYPVSDLSHDVH